MVINELLPNPFGRDADGEFIELWNSATGTVNVSGFYIADKSGKKFVLKGDLGGGAFLTLSYKDTKISLNNSGEAISFYDKNGNLLDKAGFSGTAKEGAAFARNGGSFVFTDKPTPGGKNIFTAAEATGGEKISPITYGSEVINQISGFETVALGLLAAGVLAALMARVIKNIGLEPDNKKMV